MKLNEAYASYQNDKSEGNYEVFGKSLLAFVNSSAKQQFSTSVQGDIEDIAGNAVIRVLEKLDTYQSKAPFYAWVARIVYNEGQRLLHKEASRPEQAYTGMESYNPGPSLHDKITLEQMAKHLAHPERVLLQAKLEGVSDKEIARDMRVPVGTIKSRWNKLKAELRTLGGGN